MTLCRRQGITSAKVDNIELQFGVIPDKPVRHEVLDPMETLKIPEPNVFDPMTAIAHAKAEAAKHKKAIEDYIDTPDNPTEEQLMYYSVRPETPQEQQ